MRRAARVDQTQREIVRALERAGCQVKVIGLPFDLLVARAGHLYLLECKSKGGKLTAGQERDMALGWPVTVVWTAEHALRAVGLVAGFGDD